MVGLEIPGAGGRCLERPVSVSVAVAVSVSMSVSVSASVCGVCICWLVYVLYCDVVFIQSNLRWLRSAVLSGQGQALKHS